MDLSALLQLLLTQRQQGPPPEDQALMQDPSMEDPSLTPPPGLAPPPPPPNGLAALSPGMQQALMGGAAGAGANLMGLVGAIGRRMSTGRWQDPSQNPLLANASSLADKSMERLKQEMQDKHETDKLLLTEADKAVRELAGVDLSAIQDKVPATVLRTLQEFSKNHWGMVLGGKEGKGGVPNTAKIQEFLSFYNSVRPLIMGAQKEHDTFEADRIKAESRQTQLGSVVRAGGSPDDYSTPPTGEDPSDLELGKQREAEDLAKIPVRGPNGETYMLPPKLAAPLLGRQAGEEGKDRRALANRAAQFALQDQRLKFMADKFNTAQSGRGMELINSALLAASDKNLVDINDPVAVRDFITKMVQAKSVATPPMGGGRGLSAPPGTSRYKVEQVIPGR